MVRAFLAWIISDIHGIETMRTGWNRRGNSSQEMYLGSYRLPGLRDRYKK
jgi:hypothetical protein